ncbi:hypothetical protein ACI2JA_03160 [Alkalihalobacillus sp. NPDC078783]
MIITKPVKNFSGYIEYSYDKSFGLMYDEITEEDREEMFESDTFKSLSELIKKMSQETLDEIKNKFNASEVWISCISFKGSSEDKETMADISVFDEGIGRGHIATKIHDEDITNGALLNIKKIKEIVDNTIEHYPVKY